MYSNSTPIEHQPQKKRLSILKKDLNMQHKSSLYTRENTLKKKREELRPLCKEVTLIRFGSDNANDEVLPNPEKAEDTMRMYMKLCSDPKANFPKNTELNLLDFTETKKKTFGAVPEDKQRKYSREWMKLLGLENNKIFGVAEFNALLGLHSFVDSNVQIMNEAILSRKRKLMDDETSFSKKRKIMNETIALKSTMEESKPISTDHTADGYLAECENFLMNDDFGNDNVNNNLPLWGLPQILNNQNEGIASGYSTPSTTGQSGLSSETQSTVQQLVPVQGTHNFDGSEQTDILSELQQLMKDSHVPSMDDNFFDTLW